MRDTEVAASNAVTLAQAVTAVATEIARTGLDIASISVNRPHGRVVPIRVSVQAISAEDLPTLARLFPGLPLEPRVYSGGYSTSAEHAGAWTGMGIDLDIFGPVAVTA